MQNITVMFEIVEHPIPVLGTTPPRPVSEEKLFKIYTLNITKDSTFSYINILVT